jgi:hypothetical protein
MQSYHSPKHIETVIMLNSAFWFVFLCASVSLW